MEFGLLAMANTEDMAWLAGYYSNQQMKSAISNVRKLVCTYPPYPLLGYRGAERNEHQKNVARHCHKLTPLKETHLQRRRMAMVWF